MVVFPPPLRSGDRVAVVSPAGPVRDRAVFDRGVARLEALGLRPVVLPHCLRANGYLAGSDDERASDLQQAIDDPELRAIFCSRGGYGAMRILDRLDFGALRERPKLLVGYSDITALLAAAFAAAGLVGLHGPMVVTADDFAMGEECAALRRALLFDSTAPPALPDVGGDVQPHTIVPGDAEGRLAGGNLSLVVSLIGTPWQIDTRDRIVFLEDIGEEPYRIDRMLTQLRLGGFFRHAAGVVLGDFHVTDTPLGSEDPAVVAVLRDRLGDLAVPVTHGWPFGHRPRSWTLPFGARARLRAESIAARPRFELLEPATAE